MEYRLLPRWVSPLVAEDEPRAFVYALYSRTAPEMKYIGRTGSLLTRAHQHENGIRNALGDDAETKNAYAYLSDRGIET